MKNEAKPVYIVEYFEVDGGYRACYLTGDKPDGTIDLAVAPFRIKTQENNRGVKRIKSVKLFAPKAKQDGTAPTAAAHDGTPAEDGTAGKSGDKQ